MHEKMAAALDTVIARIRAIQGAARGTAADRDGDGPRWPMIVMRTPEGWTGPKEWLVPTPEMLAAASILREPLPELRVRVLNVVDLMRLGPATEHPHGMSDAEFDPLFIPGTPVI